MYVHYTTHLSDGEVSLEDVGGKGASLSRLASAGLPVPGGFHITTDAYRRFVTEHNLQPAIMASLERVDLSKPTTLEAASSAIRSAFVRAPIPPEIATEILQAYAALPGYNPAVAVRSSATAEDLPTASYAGQQETYLNVRGAAAVLEATRNCWASLWTARAIGYRAQQEVAQEDMALAVVVQLLVPAEAAGILFTANPVTGERGQAVISAAWGLGEAVVGGTVTPDNFTVDKATGRMVMQEIADKQVMTVRVNGGTGEQPVPDLLRRVPILDSDKAAELTRLGVQIESLFGTPMDIEWALADGAFAILQARPITALPEPEVEPPAEWPLPNPKGHYMRVSVVDLMPKPLSPLFATMGLRAINEAIRLVLEDMRIAPRDAVPPDLLCTINGYAYEGVAFTARQWWLLLSRMVPRSPRMLREGVPFWRDRALPKYGLTAARWRERSLQELTPGELLAGSREVMAACGYHLGALMTSTMGPSAGAEGLFTGLYNRLVRREGDALAPTFLMGFDSIPMRSEKALYDMALWCRSNAELSSYLETTAAEEVVARWTDEEPPSGVSSEAWGEWRRQFRSYLERYGYSIYDLDFASPLPIDDPAPGVETLKLFLSGQGASPYERQQATARRREEAVASARGRLRGARRWAFEKALSWAQKQAPLREDGIAEIGLGYPVLRDLLRELGRRLVSAGTIAAPDDIFWLEEAEVERVVAMSEGNSAPPRHTDAVEQRKALRRARQRVTPPPQLPAKKKYLGFDVQSYVAVDESLQVGDILKGVGASPGRVTATACVLAGPEEFDQMRRGDVLVANITTPAWTPLFALASGIVTDIGGPLSHGSIVAREYGIPAVLGTGVATRRIHSGQAVTVDGSMGRVTLSGEQ